MTPPMQTIEIGGLTVGEGLPHLIIAGPCVIEDAGLVMETAKELKRITGDLKLPFIFKSSYDKANRSSGQSFRGPGIKAGLDGAGGQCEERAVSGALGHGQRRAEDRGGGQ